MNATPHKNAFNDAGCFDTDKQGVSAFAKRIFFVTGEQGCGKSTFLAALIQKFNLQPSGFITKKEAAPSEVAVYMHPVIDGTARYRYTTGNRVGICSPPKPAGFAPVFDACGVMCLKQAETALQQSVLPVIFMDELGVMEAEAELFFRTVCDLFFNARYYILGVVKPRGTRFLPVLEQMPEAAVLHLTLRNRAERYAQLERAYSFAAFLAAAGTERAAR